MPADVITRLQTGIESGRDTLVAATETVAALAAFAVGTSILFAATSLAHRLSLAPTVEAFDDALAPLDNDELLGAGESF